jgi:hypothetical protein
MSREVRIRREPSGWLTVEEITYDEGGRVSVKPSYHMNLGKALWKAYKWIWKR